MEAIGFAGVVAGGGTANATVAAAAVAGFASTDALLSFGGSAAYNAEVLTNSSNSFFISIFIRSSWRPLATAVFSVGRVKIFSDEKTAQ